MHDQVNTLTEALLPIVEKAYREGFLDALVALRLQLLKTDQPAITVIDVGIEVARLGLLKHTESIHGR